MNYVNLYNALIKNSQSQKRNKKLGVYEEHHIVPKCLGGADTADNLVLLTPREHFIAHVLLWKANKSDYRLFAPLLFFKNNKHVKNSRTYEKIRIAHAEYMRTNNPSLTLSNESKKQKSEKLSKYALSRSRDTNNKISASNKGKKKRLGAVLSEETKSKIRSSLKDYFSNSEISHETRSKISAALTGKFHTAETKAKFSEAQKKSKDKKYVCPNCKMALDAQNFSKHMTKYYAWTPDKVLKFKQENGPMLVNSMMQDLLIDKIKKAQFTIDGKYAILELE